MDIEAEQQFHQGCERLEQENWTEAARLFRSARDGFLAVKRYSDAAISDMNLGNALESIGEYNAALAALDRAASHFREASLEEELADADLNSGVILEALDRPVDALSRYAEAYAAYHELGLTHHAAIAKLNAGVVHEGLRQYAAAQRDFAEALSLFSSVGYNSGFEEARRAMTRLEAYE